MLTHEKEKQLLPGLGTLIAHDVLKQDAKFRLIPLSHAAPLPMLGVIEAGFPSPAEESLADNISLDDLLIEPRSELPGEGLRRFHACESGARTWSWSRPIQSTNPSGRSRSSRSPAS